MTTKKIPLHYLGRDGFSSRQRIKQIDMEGFLTIVSSCRVTGQVMKAPADHCKIQKIAAISRNATNFKIGNLDGG